MRKNMFIYPVCFTVLLLASLTSCGQSPADMGEVLSVQTEEPTAAAEQDAPFTEEELRQAISELMEDEASLAQKQAYYERLLAMDVFGEEDYVELARIYGSRGNWEEQRRMLSKVLRLYPSVEYAQQLSAVTVYRDDTEEDMAALAGRITEALEQQDVQALRALALSEEWHRLLQEGMDAIETRTHYQAGEDILQIATGGRAVEITWCGGQGRFLFYRADAAGAVLGAASLEDGSYAGEVKTAYYDGEGNVTKSVHGTLAGGVCVGQLTVVYQGVEYVGMFQEDGSTAEEQTKEVAAQGGVIYAYAQGGRTYLYQADADPADFRIGPAFFGLPEYEEWR